MPEGIRPYFKPAARGIARPWKVTDLCRAYTWPSGLAGGGVIAIVELGGARDPKNLAAFCKALGMPEPAVADVGAPFPSDPNGADGEVELDIQVAAASYWVATGKPAAIRVYWVQDIAAGVRAATADGCDVCSISWGADEAQWGRAAGLDMEAAAAAATAAGMIVLAAAGDNDSSDGGPTPANVDLPASAPHVIGCGGTEKPEAGEETVWNDNPGRASGEGTGGGFSTLFPLPGWQTGAPRGRGRMVPDIAANAEPRTGYEIVVAGAVQAIGGTSAVAPLYAGLFAAFGRKLGFVTPKLWANPLAFHDITRGNNGAFQALTGPDACTGLGSPNGAKLAALFARPPG